MSAIAWMAGQATRPEPKRAVDKGGRRLDERSRAAVGLRRLLASGPGPWTVAHVGEVAPDIPARRRETVMRAGEKRGLLRCVRDGVRKTWVRV